jgi:hypothetical protein
MNLSQVQSRRPSVTRAALLALTAGFSLGASSAHAAITVFTTEASYLAAISAPGTDTYNDLPLALITSPINRTAGAYTYQAAAPNNFFGAGTAADIWLSTNTASSPITFSNIPSTVRGVGGFFFTSDIAGAAVTGEIRIVATDSLGATQTVSIPGSTPNSFRGFVTDAQFTSIVVSVPQPVTAADRVSGQQPAGTPILWPTVNNLTLGAQAATPPVFGYTPAAGSTVTATGGTGLVGSTSNLTITPSIQTAGTGTGAAATTTLTCTAPPAPFAGFGQTVTAVGTGAISGGPLAGTCTRGTSAATATLTCSENQGGTAVTRTWTLNCPAGSIPSVPVNATSTWSLIALMLALFGFAAVAVRRQS